MIGFKKVSVNRLTETIVSAIIKLFKQEAMLTSNANTLLKKEVISNDTY